MNYVQYLDSIWKTKFNDISSMCYELSLAFADYLGNVVMLTIDILLLLVKYEKALIQCLE